MKEQLTNIEIRMTYLEKQYSDLDGVVRELNDKVELLVHEVRRLRNTEADAEEGGRDLPHERPPHY